MERKVPLSVVVLTKNEAGRIRDCLDSVRWADELLVVDDESQDDTAPLAELLGARVLHRKMDVEGRHRNWAHDQARHEWVLSLDADERVTPELAQEIQTLLSGTPEHQTYAIPRRNYIGSRWIQHGGWYPSAQVKLFKRSVFRWEETTVHPRAFANCSCGTLKGDLLHYSYRNLTDFVEKMNRQTTLEAEKWVQDGRSMPFGTALWRAVDRFFRAYVGKRGYRDGFWGFVVAIMGGMYQLLAWAKYTERTRTCRVEDVVEPFRSIAVSQEHYNRKLLMSHLSSYRLAGELARGKSMLEIGCGSGYGAFYLSHLARRMVAIDMDPPVITQARKLFQRPNLEYGAAQGTRLALPDASFERVGMFQVIEHIPEKELPAFLREVSRVLTADGLYITSTLNLDYNLKGNPANYVKADFHEKEFIESEYRTLLSSVFPHVELYGLHPRRRYRLFHRLKRWGLDRWGLPGWNPIVQFYENLDTDDYVVRPGCRGAIDLIGICRKAPAPPGWTLPR